MTHGLWTAGLWHYLLELLIYTSLLYFIGCILGAAWRKMTASEPMPEPQFVSTAPVQPLQKTASAPMPAAAPTAHVAAARLQKPQALASARSGKADDLQRIVGVGPANEKILHSLGIYHFDQIANWSDKEIAWVEDHMQFDGRIAREEWIKQCKLLADGNEVEFQTLYGNASRPRASRPKGLEKARGGKPDDLQRISGVGPKNEKVLHSLGFFHFDQIAEWTSEQVKWVDDHLNFNGRIAREEWIKQCKLLAAGNDAEFARLYGTGGQKSADGESKSGSRTRKG
jgi:predicted flap endonuclease-1-like 5' DNA nuclease